MKRLHWFEILLVTIIMSVHLYAAFSTAQNFPQRWFTRDDAYYYFKVAQNISEGRGSTFDGINPTNGYHPLWLVASVPIFSLARYDLILPLRILTLVMAALSAITSILLYRLLKRVLAEPIAILAAAFWAFSTTLHNIITQPGMETGIVALSVVSLLFALQKFELRQRKNNQTTHREIALLAAAALFALFSRLDAIYLLLIVGIWIIFRNSPIRSLLPADLLATLALLLVGFVQRAGLKIYLSNFSESAILTFAIIFTAQSLVFYFIGLYQHPKNTPIPQLLRQIGIAATSGTIVLIGLSLLASPLGISVPRAVSLYYLIGMSLWLFISRKGYAAFSPWVGQPSNQAESSLTVLLANWKTWLGRGLVYYGLSALALGLYMLTNLALFGTFMPVSGQIKRWWGGLGDNAYGGAAKSLLDIFGIDPQRSQPWELLFQPIQAIADQTTLNFWAILLGLALISLALAALNREKTANALTLLGLAPLAISAGVHATFYGAMPYAARHEWYWVTQMLTIVIGLALFAHLATARIRKSTTARRLALGLALLVSAGLAWDYTQTITSRMTFEEAANPAYMDILPLLEANTEPGSVIGMTGGGNVGYYIQGRTIVNMDGLINSYPYFRALQDNQAPKYLQDTVSMDYVFANPYLLLSTAPYSYQFQGWIEEIPDAPRYGNKQILRFGTPD